MKKHLPLALLATVVLGSLATATPARAQETTAAAGRSFVFADYVALAALRLRYLSIAEEFKSGTMTTKGDSGGSDFDAVVQSLHFRGGIDNLIVRLSLFEGGGGLQAGVLLADMIEVGGHLAGSRRYTVDFMTSAVARTTQEQTNTRLFTGPYAIFTIPLSDMLALELEGQIGFGVGSVVNTTTVTPVAGPTVETKTEVDQGGITILFRGGLVVHMTDHLDYSPELVIERAANSTTSPNAAGDTEFTVTTTSVAFLPLGLRFRF